jgi:hypothetical protein
MIQVAGQLLIIFKVDHLFNVREELLTIVSAAVDCAQEERLVLI